MTKHVTAMAATRHGGPSIAAACVALVMSAAPLVAQASASGEPTFERSPAEGYPGTVVNVSGEGCIEGGKPYEEASVLLGNGTFDGPHTRYRIQSDGTWGGEYVVPQEAPPGEYRLSASCSADDMVFPLPGQDYRVLDRTPPTSVPTTSSTTSTPTTSPSTTSAPSTPPRSNTLRPRSASTSSSSPSSSSTMPSSTTEPTVDPRPSVPLAAPGVRSGETSGGSRLFAPFAVVGALLALAGAAVVTRRRRATRRSTDS